MHYVYILYSPSKDRYYVGSTHDPEQRVYKHNKKHRGYTAQVDNWSIKYQETFPTKTEALRRERQIKSWKSRKLIERIVQQHG